MFTPILIGLTVVTGVNWLLENIILPTKGVVGNENPECLAVELALTPEELQQLMDSSALVRAGINRATLLESA